jgi:hypothetical protein
MEIGKKIWGRNNNVRMGRIRFWGCPEDTLGIPAWHPN